MDIAEQITQMEKALLEMDRFAALSLMEQAVTSLAPATFAEQIMVPAVTRIGSSWEDGSVSLSQVYMAGRICETMVTSLFPGPSRRDLESPYRVGIAVLGDRHFLGKRIVKSVVLAAGYAVKDYGFVDPHRLAQQVQDDGIELILVSSLMLSAALKVKELVRLLRRRSGPVKVAVGGAPFLLDPSLWQEVDADCMGRTATDALSIVETYLSTHDVPRSTPIRPV